MRLLLALLAAIPVWADTGNAVCARCHAAIARQYAATGMAQSSGRTGAPGFQESFGHPSVNANYDLRIGAATRRLEWFLGSGHIGRSYLFRKGGQLFQAPLSYYTGPRKWDLSPGYQHMEMTRAVEPACLQCHASRLQPAGAAQPYLQAGVGCERCHGPGEKHAAQPAKTNIVNPARLAPEERDSVCAQCHLTGAARIARAGRERGSFKPGEKLRDSIAVFVRDGADVSATSHYEKLAASRCKQKSGETLWCGTCHTPHADATPAHYRQQCQGCHTAGSCKANAGDDCVGCHMPRSAGGQSIAHLAFTDHSIPRRAAVRQPPTAEGSLKEFWTGTATLRDTALANAAAGSDAAYPLLTEAVKSNPKDVPLLTQLAQFHERANKLEEAGKVYAAILLLDPANTTAAVNLGTIQIRQGQAKEAMANWVRALTRNPALIAARLNLAVAQYQSGDPASARRSLESVLDYEPEHPTARRMLEQIPPP